MHNFLNFYLIFGRQDKILSVGNSVIYDIILSIEGQRAPLVAQMVKKMLAMFPHVPTQV